MEFERKIAGYRQYTIGKRKTGKGAEIHLGKGRESDTEGKGGRRKKLHQGCQMKPQGILFIFT